MSLRQIQLNPDLKPATWEQIKYYRDTFELEPITLDDGRTFDYDDPAMKRMLRATNNWAALDKEPDGTLGWKLHDNTITYVTLVELQTILTELDLKQAQRASKLHKQAEIFNATGALLGTVKVLSNWL